MMTFQKIYIYSNNNVLEANIIKLHLWMLKNKCADQNKNFNKLYKYMNVFAEFDITYPAKIDSVYVDLQIDD